ncbi:MAG: ATP-binding protein [Myxococcaceae bacterium]
MLVFRTVATSLILVAIVARALSQAQASGNELGSSDAFAFVLVGIVYFITLASALWLRTRPPGRVAVLVQIGFDVLFAGAVVYLTGGADSPFVFAYSLTVLAGSILLFRTGALVAATASTLAHAAILLVDRLGLNGAVPEGSPSRMVFLFVSNGLSQFLIAVLGGYLAEQVIQAGGRVAAREKDLRELVDLQNRIVNAMPSGLITCEASGLITFINPSAAAILGLGDQRPDNIDQIIPGALKLTPNARRSELIVTTPKGSKSLGLACTPLGGAAGALLIVFQDLTELRKMEAELKRVDHLASLGRFSAQLAHEIRNPLASMRGSAQMLSSDGENSKLAEIIVREADRLSGLVESYLKLARPPPPRPEQVRVDQVVQETVEMLRADPMASGIRIDESLSPVEGQADKAQLRQVLINLLRNALAAAGPGGRVKVSVDAHDGAAWIGVWDSAGSIPQEDLLRIFEPFYTTRQGGTGLGLSTAFSIVKAHGGMIDVSSSKAAGTTFTVGLPGLATGGAKA